MPAALPDLAGTMVMSSPAPLVCKQTRARVGSREKLTLGKSVTPPARHSGWLDALWAYLSWLETPVAPTGMRSVWQGARLTAVALKLTNTVSQRIARPTKTLQ